MICGAHGDSLLIEVVIVMALFASFDSFIQSSQHADMPE